MSVTIGTITQAAQLATSSTSRIKPHVLADRFAFSGDLFPFCAFIEPTNPKSMGPNQQPMAIPGSGKVKSMITRDINPKLYDYGTVSTQYSSGAAVAALTADTNANVTLATTKGLRKYSLIKNRRTGAVVQVQSVTSTTVAVVRGFAGGTGGTGLDAIEATDKFDFLNNAYPDGAQSQTGLRHDPDLRSNYLHLHVNETDLGMVGERLALFPDGSNGHEMNLMLNARQHNEGRERNFLFGELRDTSTTINSETITAMKGLDAWSDVEYDAEGTLTMDEYRIALAPVVFQAGGGGRKKALAGNTFLSVLDNLLDGKVHYDTPPEAIKVRLKTIEAAAGIVDFMSSQPMHEREGSAIFYDPDLMTRPVLEGLDMTFFQDVGPNDYLKKRDMWVTVESLLVHNPDSIVIVNNVLA